MKLVEKIVFSSSVIFGLFVIGPEVKSPDLERTLPILEDNLEALKDWIEDREAVIAVSYTHLTLPTSDLV